jgi:hypothetical protein
MNFNSKKTAFFVAVMLLSIAVKAQEIAAPKPEKKIVMELDGMLAISVGSNTIGINVGGPSLKFKINKNFRIGAGAFPSLVIIDNKAFPKLGVSPSIEYKHWMVIAPYYGYDAKDKMIWTFGLGYRFY